MGDERVFGRDEPLEKGDAGQDFSIYRKSNNFSKG
jgi:hypothetical protein